MASSPDSPVLIRMASSMLETKILPSPIRPVWAARRIASTAFSTMSSPSTISIFTLGRKSTTYSAPRSEEHTSELQSRLHLVCRLLLEKKKQMRGHHHDDTTRADRDQSLAHWQ